MEKYAEHIYNMLLKDVIVPLIGNDTTYLDELEGVGNLLFKNKFAGVFPSDKIPKLNNRKRYAILNLDKSGESGSHWVAIAKYSNDTYIYDSFGRNHEKIIKTLSKSGNGKITDADLDAEQEIEETNCGARCLAWLCVFNYFSPDLAKLI